MIKIESNYFKKQANVQMSIVHFEQDADGWHYVDESYVDPSRNEEDQINSFIENSISKSMNLKEAGQNIFVSDQDMFKLKNSNKKFTIKNGKVTVHV
jgi:hypothetical protein